jgi:signal transduction histidine kinase
VQKASRARAAQETFSRRLIESQEGERKRIAAELHDSLGQNLLIIKNWAALGLSRITQDNPAKGQLDEISTAAAQAIDEVRAIAYNLRPYQLDRVGLSSTIEYMVAQVAAASGIRFSLDIAPLDGVFAKGSEISVYRLVQECVNNIIKHSGASEARVVIEREAQTVQITVADNGRGFTPEAATGGRGEARRRGFGLTGLAERARLLGGSLLIQSAPGQGTTVKITLKVEEDRHGA